MRLPLTTLLAACCLGCVPPVDARVAEEIVGVVVQSDSTKRLPLPVYPVMNWNVTAMLTDQHHPQPLCGRAEIECSPVDIDGLDKRETLALVRVRGRSEKGRVAADDAKRIDGTAEFRPRLDDVARVIAHRRLGMRDLDVYLRAKLPALAGDAVEEPMTTHLEVEWMPLDRVVRIAVVDRLVRRTTTGVRPNPDPHAGTLWCDAPPGADCAPDCVPRNATVVRTDVVEQRSVTLIRAHGTTQDLPSTLDVKQAGEHLVPINDPNERCF